MISSSYTFEFSRTIWKEGVYMTGRSSGILLHIASLPGKYGIGDFGPQAYRFVDFLHKSGQRNWQILPLGVTGYGDSPYQCFSAFAGNPYFIDISGFISDGLVTEAECEILTGNSSDLSVDYGRLYECKIPLLRKVYANSYERDYENLKKFYSDNLYWLREFSLFMSIKHNQGGSSWQDWIEEYKYFDSPEIKSFEEENSYEIYFWVFTQYYFLKQWQNLKQYANSKGINIIGDIPIYVAQDSSDIWANTGLFNLDENLKPISVAGCPPDFFSPTGQLWGNPIYRWDKMDENGYQWWINRIKHSFELYDIVRIDHFRGFEAYWEIPFESKTAVNGKWVKGPGMKLFNSIMEYMGELNIIAEDLGYLTDDVRNLIRETGFPGMKVLQFAFDSEDDNEYLPHNYYKNCVAYTGTHDNETSSGWFDNSPQRIRKFAGKYLNLSYNEGISRGMIRSIWASCAGLAIAPIQDFLGIDNSGRINIPSTSGGNWTWRLNENDLTDILAGEIYELTNIYFRL